MAQFTCEICGAEFEQKSLYERHMLTSHPQQAVSAADIEKALKGIEFPQSRSGLAETLGNDQQKVKDIIQRLPDQQYRDAAEVARAFGELRTHNKAPHNQPSKTGGEHAMQSPSAARFASLFAGMHFPASREQLINHARSKASEQELKTLKQFGEHNYQSMADVTQELTKVD